MTTEIHWHDKEQITAALAGINQVGIVGEEAVIAAAESVAKRLESDAKATKAHAEHTDDMQAYRRRLDEAREYSARARAIRNWAKQEAA